MTLPVAVTGGSGFIGREVVRCLLAEGFAVRALMRRRIPELERCGVTVVRGSLESDAALRELVADVAAVVHCAGAVAAPSATAFSDVNARGSARLVAAVTATPRPARVLLLSSLAAREPEVSPYARSKREAEEVVRRCAAEGLEVSILRPPAVYGPGDRATLPIFRQLRSGRLLVPAVSAARFSLLYVSDLAGAIIWLLGAPAWSGEVLELDDGRVGGYRWRDLAEIAGRQLGRPVRTIPLPWSLLWPAAAVAALGGAALGRALPLSPGKLRELFHADWVARPRSALPGWAPRTTFEDGFAQTMAWYRQQGWL